jgi:hypothetical protein
MLTIMTRASDMRFKVVPIAFRFEQIIIDKCDVNEPQTRLASEEVLADASG